MIRITTSQYLDPHCQCMPAAVASLLEIPLDTTPEGNGEEIWDRWFASHNAKIICLNPSTDLHGFCLGFVRMADVSKPDGALHAVVLQDGKIVHDPHRDQSALKLEIVQEQIIAPLDPSAPMNFREYSPLIYRRLLMRSPNLMREFMRKVRRKRAEKRWVDALLQSWAEIDADESTEVKGENASGREVSAEVSIHAMQQAHRPEAQDGKVLLSGMPAEGSPRDA